MITITVVFLATVLCHYDMIAACRQIKYLIFAFKCDNYILNQIKFTEVNLSAEFFFYLKTSG